MDEVLLICGAQMRYNTYPNSSLRDERGRDLPCAAACILQVLVVYAAPSPYGCGRVEDVETLALSRLVNPSSATAVIWAQPGSFL